MSSLQQHPEKMSPGVWRHFRAILLLPFMNVVVIPSLILILANDFDLSWIGTFTLPTTATSIVCLFLLLLGGALIVRSIALFVGHGRGTLAPWDPPQQLLVRGIYRYVRNPMKIGLVFVLLAEVMVCRSVALAYWFGFFTTINVVYIQVWEEPDLLKRFGHHYSDYCNQVPRWIPRLTAWLADANAAVEDR